MSEEQKYQFIYQAASSIHHRILTSRDNTDNIDKHFAVLNLLDECIQICSIIDCIRVREKTDQYIQHNTSNKTGAKSNYQRRS